MVADEQGAELNTVRAQAEAAAWIALLHGPSRNAAIERGLRRWIDASPENAAAWELATDVWNDTAKLSSYGPKRHISRSSRRARQWIPALVIGVTCLIAIGFGLAYLGGSAVTTAIGEQRTLILDDGTRVQLNTDTSLRINIDRHTRQIFLKSGEAYFQVAHESRPFVVVAGDQKVIAVGTEFTVRRDKSSNDAVTVTLIEGRVAVAPVDAANALPAVPIDDVSVLTVGERLRIRPHHKPALDTPSIDKVTRWMRGQVIFDHTPLRDAAAEMSRYSHKPVRVDSSAVAGIPIGGVFRIGDVNSFASAVAQSHNLRVIHRDDGLVLESPGETR
jgi:transmembrane sensor